MVVNVMQRGQSRSCPAGVLGRMRRLMMMMRRRRSSRTRHSSNTRWHQRPAMVAMKMGRLLYGAASPGMTHLLRQSPRHLAC
jgi:hypothetical protein